MKKKILSFVLCFLLILPLVLMTGCEKKSDEQIIAEIVESGQTAYTLTLWMPTEMTDTESDSYKENIAAVEEALNAIFEKSYIHIVLKAIPDASYEKEVKARMDSIQALLDGGADTAARTGMEYKNVAEKYYPDENSEDYIYRLKYPDVLDTQFDLFLIRDAETYRSLANAEKLKPLNDYLSSSGGRYTILDKYVFPALMNAAKVNGKIYGVPVNHAIGEGTYFLVNKEVVSRLGEESYAELLEELDYFADGRNPQVLPEVTLSTLEPLITALATSGLAEMVPVSGDFKAGLTYWSENGEYSLLCGSTANPAPHLVFEDDEYNASVRLLKLLESENAIGTPAEGESAGLTVVTCDATELETYKEDNYVLCYGAPSATEDALYSSIFAISSYCVETDRAMQVLVALNTNKDVKTILQYGIEGKHFTYNFNDENQRISISEIPGNTYFMNNLYTGNEYMTFPGYDLEMSGWEAIKKQNLSCTADPYAGLREYFENTFAKGDSAVISAFAKNAEDLVSFSADVLEKIDAMSAEEYANFLTAWANADDTNEVVAMLLGSDLLTKLSVESGSESFTALYKAYAGV